MYDGTGPYVSTDYTYNGVDAAFLENEHLRLQVLPGKGGDIVEFRDKRRDVNVLWDPDFGWTPPADRHVPAETPTTWQTDHFPGGWQVNLPIAGYGSEIPGSAYGLHGESALIPWDASASLRGDAAVLTLETTLTRYPFAVRRELTLPAGEPRLHVAESVTNEGGVELEYIWQQHVALGTPLVGPGARLDVPAGTCRVEEYGDDFPTARLAGGQSFEWPEAPAADGGTVDLRESFPPRDAEVHDQVYATDLDAGWYALTNPDLDVGFGLTFPTDPFECLWYWQPFGGYDEAPFYRRNYNVGLEPTTAYPGDGLPDAQRENGTMKTLAPGETVEAEFTARTYTGVESVDGMDPDGTLHA